MKKIKIQEEKILPKRNNQMLKKLNKIHQNNLKKVLNQKIKMKMKHNQMTISLSSLSQIQKSLNSKIQTPHQKKAKENKKTQNRKVKVKVVKAKEKEKLNHPKHNQQKRNKINQEK